MQSLKSKITKNKLSVPDEHTDGLTSPNYRKASLLKSRLTTSTYYIEVHYRGKKGKKNNTFDVYLILIFLL